MAVRHSARLPRRTSSFGTIGGAAAVPQGVSLETLNLFPAPWPPPPPGPDDLRAAVQIVGEAREKVAHAEPLVVNVQNRGSIAWADSAAEPDWSGNTALQFRWRSLSSGAEDRSQRLRLARVLHPGDTVEAEVPLVPPAALDRLGPWELAIVAVTASRHGDPARRAVHGPRAPDAGRPDK